MQDFFVVHSFHLICLEVHRLCLSAPRAQAAGVLTFLPRFQSSSPERESWLLCGFASTFGPTRSGTGDAHASGQGWPLIRTLLVTLVCEPQARLRTFRGNDIPGTRGDGICWIKVSGQERRIQIALHRANSARALVPALRERLFERLAAPVTELAEFGRACGDFNQGAARACNGASQLCYKHPWCAQSDASPVLFLPRFVVEFLEEDGVAYRQELMDLLPMQALAMSRQLAFFAGLPASGFLVAPTCLPVQLLLAAC